MDGWRALSIILVLGGHCKATIGFPAVLSAPFLWLFDGGLGVRFFFVISGFLISWLMLVEFDHYGSVSLKAFYGRRALRILPVYFGFLLVVAVLQRLTAYSQSALAWFGNLTFTTNFIDCPWTTEHLWSLSTEEQFYLLWPGLFVCFIAGAKKKNTLWMLLLPVGVAPVCRVMGYKSYPAFLYPLTRHFSFFSYFDSLAVGCLAAITLARERGFIQKYFENRPLKTLYLGLLLVLVPYVLTRLRWIRQLMVPFEPTSEAFGFGILLILSILHSQWGAFRALNWKWVCRIGVLSYSIYIWQQIFCSDPAVFGIGPVWWMAFPTWLIPVFALSFLSYYGFERPFLKLRARLRRA